MFVSPCNKQLFFTFLNLAIQSPPLMPPLIYKRYGCNPETDNLPAALSIMLIRSNGFKPQWFSAGIVPNVKILALQTLEVDINL
ncbi:hypothetical protein [Vibrio pelagius]|uniref:hypothetical protein n=1 Tax=Vibrio pelagius TaxID=28169 RepID=UPI00355155B5